jgi:hypothetical protein
MKVLSIVLIISALNENYDDDLSSPAAYKRCVIRCDSMQYPSKEDCKRHPCAPYRLIDIQRSVRIQNRCRLLFHRVDGRTNTKFRRRFLWEDLQNLWFEESILIPMRTNHLLMGGSCSPHPKFTVALEHSHA